MKPVRTCKTCSKEKPVAEFAKANPWRCKRCDADRCRRYYESTREVRKAAKRAAYWQDPEKSRSQRRAQMETPRAKELNKAAVERYKAKHPERAAAHRAVQLAVKRGTIVKPDCCQAAGCTAAVKHAHHFSYLLPLDVDFLCTRHHEACHHLGPVRLKLGLKRKFAVAPQNEIARAA